MNTAQTPAYRAGISKTPCPQPQPGSKCDRRFGEALGYGRDWRKPQLAVRYNTGDFVENERQFLVLGTTVGAWTMALNRGLSPMPFKDNEIELDGYLVKFLKEYKPTPRHEKTTPTMNNELFGM